MRRAGCAHTHARSSCHTNAGGVGVGVGMGVGVGACTEWGAAFVGAVGGGANTHNWV